MKKIALLLILCSAIAYGTEETYPTLYFLPGAESSIPTILYLQSGSGGSMVVEERNGEMRLSKNLSITEITYHIENYDHKKINFLGKIDIIVPEEDYDECKRALEKRCGKGIQINNEIPKTKKLLKFKFEEMP